MHHRPLRHGELAELIFHPELKDELSSPDWLDFILGSYHLMKEYGDYHQQDYSGIRDGVGPFPSEEILRLYKSLGGEIITVGSDAHRPQDAAKCVDRGQEVLKVCGFKYITVFTKRKPEFIPL